MPTALRRVQHLDINAQHLDINFIYFLLELFLKISLERLRTSNRYILSYKFCDKNSMSTSERNQEPHLT